VQSVTHSNKIISSRLVIGSAVRDALFLASFVIYARARETRRRILVRIDQGLGRVLSMFFWIFLDIFVFIQHIIISYFCN
jgi:hypothetical protein